MSDWIGVGQDAPEFSVKDDHGNDVQLSALRGRPVVLYFYPKDDTPGCTVEACAFRDRSDELAELNVAVLGVSPDDVASHSAFRDKFSLNFPLLADTDRSIATAYGAWRERERNGEKFMGIQRSTFLIDTNGKIAKTWTTVDVKVHDSEVIDAVKEL